MPVNVVAAEQVSSVGGNRYVEEDPNTYGSQNDHRSHNKTNQKTKVVGPSGWRCRARQLDLRLHLVRPREPVFIDCEGVILHDESGWRRKGLARFTACVNGNGKGPLALDTFVYYPADVPHRPPPQRLNLGVKYNDIKPKNGAQPIEQVLDMARQIFDKSGFVVGHALKNDMEMLRGLPWEDYTLRDTQLLPEYRQLSLGVDGNVSLQILSSVVLKRAIQSNGRSSIEDCRATKDLLNRHQQEINSTQANLDLVPHYLDGLQPVLFILNYLCSIWILSFQALPTLPLPPRLIRVPLMQHEGFRQI